MWCFDAAVGHVALVRNRRHLEGTQPDGNPVELDGLSADVVRRAEDGSRRILIDDPWGGGSSSCPVSG